MFTKITNQIRVTAVPRFLRDHSEPEDDHYVWAYTIQLENMGSETVQLLGRYWNITDAHGLIQEVEGEGVVGEQPVLQPGEAFEYTSGTALGTPSGIMHGKYAMANPQGELFEIDIPAFLLDSPFQPSRLN